MAETKDLNNWLSTLREGLILEEKNTKKLCEQVKELLAKEPNVLQLSSPVTVCADLHGQFYDLQEIFKKGGEVPETNYLFLGDYVDRGYHSVETISYLLVLKLRYPSNISLLRGTHESRQITQVYGFYDECIGKYGNPEVWRYFCELFDFLPIAAVIDNAVFCVHGGLSPEISTIDEIQLINRYQEIPYQGPMCDLLYSLPSTDIEDWCMSYRGAGFLFGIKPFSKFMETNKQELFIQTNFLHSGYCYNFNNKLITLFSAPNYCYRSANIAAFLVMKKNLEHQIVQFSQSPLNEQFLKKRIGLIGKNEENH